jgi:hypothetical protein
MIYIRIRVEGAVSYLEKIKIITSLQIKGPSRRLKRIRICLFEYEYGNLCLYM